MYKTILERCLAHYNCSINSITIMIMFVLSTQKVNFLFNIVWLSPRHLKLDIFGDELFVSSLLNLVRPQLSSC